MDNRMIHTPNEVSRRSFLQMAGTAATVGFLGRKTTASGVETQAPQGFRFVHLTDIHVQPELRAGEGFRKCLAAVHELKPRPDFILTGGDLVMDVLGVDLDRAKALFDLYTGICKDSDIPFRQCVGNHDVLGWGSPRKVSPDHALYGKRMVQERLGLDRTTYSFDHKGWHFCVVDDIMPVPGEGYEGGFSNEDLHWLTDDLKAAGSRPKILCAHIPIVSVAVFRNSDASRKPNIEVAKGAICRNSKPILDLLRNNRVNLVLAGHLHENETLTYDGTTHISEAAVCGAWWKGAHLDNPEGFGIIDVRPDGTFTHAYQTYGWKADPPAPKG